jgi:hypothetical protein
MIARVDGIDRESTVSKILALRIIFCKWFPRVIWMIVHISHFSAYQTLMLLSAPFASTITIRWTNYMRSSDGTRGVARPIKHSASLGELRNILRFIRMHAVSWLWGKRPDEPMRRRRYNQVWVWVYKLANMSTSKHWKIAERHFPEPRGSEPGFS